MMLFGRFRSTYIQMTLCATAHKSNRRLLTIHDEGKDNADMHPFFQQFISDPTISGRFLKSKQQFDMGEHASLLSNSDRLLCTYQHLRYIYKQRKKFWFRYIFQILCILLHIPAHATETNWMVHCSKLKTRSYPIVYQTILSSSYTLLIVLSSLLVLAPSPASTLTQSMLPVMAGWE